MTIRKIFRRTYAVMLVILFFVSKLASAGEGMWLPFLLQYNEKEMKAMGLKITAKDIYDANQASLKDAVLIFGGGCTGEVISNQGLVLTNHHCGYGTAQGLSSLQNDYLKYGFWAKNNAEELPCPGLSVTFIKRIDDVTTQILNGLSTDFKNTERLAAIKTRTEKLIADTKKETGYDVIIKSFFNDNKYYMFLQEKYTDIRMVGFPPNGIGKFGGDTDNWAWPRHTGDFSLFRIYTDKNNKPAAYSKDNVPYKPKKFFTINAKGVKEGDFTMVYGFPGRTNEYLTHDGVREVMETLDPARIKIRGERLNIMDKSMASDREIFLKYAGKQASIANYYKKWQGELMGLKTNDAINAKIKKENSLTTWINANTNRYNKYGSVIGDLEKIYASQKNTVLLNEYINEAIDACELLQQGATINKILKTLETQPADSVLAFQKTLEGFYKNYDYNTDIAIAKKMVELFAKQFPAYGSTDIEAVYKNSLLSQKEKLFDLLKSKDKEKIVANLKTDPIYTANNFYDSIYDANAKILNTNKINMQALYYTYMQALQEYGTAKYPDANFTLRLTYGKVQGLHPRDGMNYNYYTTLDGVMQKENPDVEEFEVPSKLKELYIKKDYGMYAMKNGKVPLAFIASNHTTGGNSGSPVLNAKGELIGTNFDRIWEGTMSDIMYDINLCRNITLDVRYTLFIIEKFGGAGWLLNEMKIVR